MTAPTRPIRKEVIGSQTLILGDCMEVMPTLSRFDAVVTDPPYGIGQANGMRGGGTGYHGTRRRAPRQWSGNWDEKRPDPEVFEAVFAAAERHVIWGGQYFTDLLPPSQKWLVWNKNNSMPTYSDAELAWTSLPGKSLKMITRTAGGNGPNAGRGHPTQKPLAVMMWSLGFLQGSTTILDPFMGSGTTLVACQRLGRVGTGIEIDPDYFEIACRRVDEATRQRDMFVAAEVAMQSQQETLL